MEWISSATSLRQRLNHADVVNSYCRVFTGREQRRMKVCIVTQTNTGKRMLTLRNAAAALPAQQCRTL